MYVQCSEILFRAMRTYSMRHVLLSKQWSSQAQETEGNDYFHRRDPVRKKQEEQSGTCPEEQWNVSKGGQNRRWSTSKRRTVLDRTNSRYKDMETGK